MSLFNVIIEKEIFENIKVSHPTSKAVVTLSAIGRSEEKKDCRNFFSGYIITGKIQFFPDVKRHPNQTVSKPTPSSDT